MPKHGKKYLEAQKQVDAEKPYQPQEAISLLKQINYVKFNPTVEVHMKLGVDPRHADQMVRGVAMLPAGTGKEVKVLVFAQGEKAAEAEAAGADFVGLDDIIMPGLEYRQLGELFSWRRISGAWEVSVALISPYVVVSALPHGNLREVMRLRAL